VLAAADEVPLADHEVPRVAAGVRSYSDEYEPLKRLRHQSAESSIVLLDAAVR
jgi:hypothetical protein